VMSRMSSTPLLDAASSSVTSSDVPLVIATQLAQTLQASPSSGFSQLSAFARIRAVVVFPSARTRKEIRVRNPLVLHRSLQGAHHVVLTTQFHEPTGSKSAIERSDAVDRSRVVDASAMPAC